MKITASTTAVATAARRTFREKFGTKRLLGLIMLLVLPLTIVFGAVSATAADDEDLMKFSFYRVASSTTAFFSTMQEPGSEESFSPEWEAMIADPGSAGSLLGYADPNFSPTMGWLESKLSGSSDAIGYDSLRIRNDDGSYVSAKHQGMIDYAYFGAALQGMGLDSTSTGLSLGFTDWLGGGVVMLLFMLGGATDFLFTSVIGVLAMLNPFKLFHLAMEGVNGTFADGMVGGDGNVGPLMGVANFISGWYQILVDLSWTIMVPLFLAVLIVSLLLFKKMDRGGAAKKFIVRLVFIGLGLPLLGSMYTGTIDSMNADAQLGNHSSARVVMSTYVDFENWAYNSRLAIPDGAIIEWDQSSASPSGKALAHVRDTALAINNQTHSLGMKPFSSLGEFDASFSSKAMGEMTESPGSARIFDKTFSLLQRYMDGAQVTSASLENGLKGGLTQTDDYKSKKSTVNGWFESMTKDASELNKQDPTANPVISVKKGSGLRAHAAGGQVRGFTSSTSGCIFSGKKISSSDGSPMQCNLSPLAMYNYLNTDFGPTSMQMYSSAQVASEATRSVHNSVNQVGTGAMGFLYWLNTVVLLGAFVTIGFGYALTTLFAAVRRSIQIIGAVPFATMGAIAGIAKVIVYTVALILQVLVTIFIYQFVGMFLSSLPQIIEMPFAQLLNEGKGGEQAAFVDFLIGGPGFALVVTVLSIIGVIAFTVLAMRLRKSFVKAVEEAVTKLVEKFLDTSAAMPSGGVLAPALAGGLASGAGAVMAGRMMNKQARPSGDPTSVSSDGNGPSSISTAGGLIDSDPDGGGSDVNLAVTGGPGGGPGNGDPGSPLEISSGAGAEQRAAADEVALGREVEQNGLSKRGEIRDPQVGSDDPMSAAQTSMDDSASGYKEADRKRLEGGKEGVQAAGHAALAVGRGVAGDGKGAAESGGRAVQHGGQAVASGHEAKATADQAGKSSLDRPDTRHVRAAQNARQVSQLGGYVADGAASAGSTTPKAPSSGSAPRAAQPSRGSSPTGVQPRQSTAGGHSTGPAPRQAPRQAPRAPQAPASPRQLGTTPPKKAPQRMTPQSGNGVKPAPQAPPATTSARPVRSAMPPRKAVAPKDVRNNPKL